MPSVLARGTLYRKAGFTLAAKQPHDRFGRKGLVGETWELKL